MTYLLGVDGGTSKTKALVCKPDCTIVGHAKTGGSNVYEGDPEAGLAEAMRAAEEAITSAGLAPDDISHSVFSMSGADWPEDMLMIRVAARARGFGRTVDVVNDAIGGMYAGLPQGNCVAVICGTHAACAARGTGGKLWHNSFWQLIGGAHDLGSAGLTAVYRSELGIIPPTSLTQVILEHFGESDVESLLHRQTALFAEPFPNLALLAPLVLDQAQLGDAAATKIVTDQGRGLAEYAIAAARRVDIELEPYQLVLGGSVFLNESPLLADTIADTMRQRSPHLTVTRSRHEPVLGAILLALDHHGVPPTPTTLARIVATLPTGWR